MDTASDLSLWFDSALLPQGWCNRVRFGLTAGRITQVSIEVDPAEGDERYAVVVPGIPNLHSHAFQRGLAGLTERRGPEGDSFWTWRELMYQFVERVRPEEFEAIAALAYAEMLESGFTHVGEFHYLHHDRGGAPFENPGELAHRIVAAAASTGIGLTLLPTFYAHSGFGGREPQPRQARFINDRERFAAIVESCRRVVEPLRGATVGIAPHSLRAVTPDELKWLAAEFSDTLLHIHIAEQVREVEDCVSWSGRRPLEWLLEHAAPDDRWCLVHATHVNEAELQEVARCGAVVGLCPVTEANLGDGIFPAAAFLALGGRFGVGSDSNVLIDAAEELRLLEYSQRLTLRGRNVLAGGPDQSTGRALFERTLAGGAQALRCTSGLARGNWFDAVSLKAGQAILSQRQRDALLDSWVFSGGQRSVDCVWRAGEKVVSGGRHIRRDAISARYRGALKQLLA
ncbi:MAG: formimidoylglutamate deiminase [Sinobacteraceae bacterium]|nr:formimidoylglutamate deiminase [Nevskiaceae bacterium]